jgi:hypothetical protein
MRRLSTVAFVALTLTASLAYAERPYESSRPDMNSADKPYTIHHESFKPTDVRPNPRGELVLPAKEGNVDTRFGKPMIRPDASRDAFMPVNEEGRPRSVRANQEVQKGKPSLRPDAKREAFMPVNEETGRARAINANHEVKKGAPNLRPEAKRDAFVPTDEATGLKRGLNPNKDMKPATTKDGELLGRQMVCSFTALCGE